MTAKDITRAISHLPKQQRYHYIHKGTKTQLEIVGIDGDEGPIRIRRITSESTNQTISSSMLWRVANAFTPDVPFNIDRVLAGSYNTRSALESLLAHTPHFFVCRPFRVEANTAGEIFKKGHKYLLWLPNDKHQLGRVEFKETDRTVSEVPTLDAIYEALTVPESVFDPKSADDKLSEDVKRRHAQIQIRLVEIGAHLGFKTWVAINDRAIIYDNKPLGQMRGVISDLNSDTVISARNEAIQAALRVDCIWFKNAKLMPAVIEIEQSTGVVTGLSRMKTLQDAAPAIRTRFVIAADDADRAKVMKHAAKEQFASLRSSFFPYSAIEELHALCKKRKLRGITDDFMECFLEPCVPDNHLIS
jgi:type II restriction enzyme